MTRDHLRMIDTRQRRDVRLLFTTLSDALENAFARHTTPGQPITALDRARIMADVDVALDVIYGTRINDPDAALTQIVLRETTDARFRPLDDAVKVWRGKMSRTLRERVEAEVRE